MAASVARNLEDDIMVVLAGGGQIIHKFGIPDKAFRRTSHLFTFKKPDKFFMIDVG